MDNKAKVLFILHLPPPVHGAAIMGQLVKDSAKINDAFDAEYINLSIAKKLSEIQKYGIQKAFRLLKLQARVFWALLRNRYDLCYITLTVNGSGFYKDLLIVLLLKLFRRRIIYHFHNKGVENARRLSINRLLYRFTFRNTKSILLSSHLYSDIARYVDEKDVYYCSNGIPRNSVKNVKKPAKNGDSICKLLFFSNMMMQKGVYVLLDACKILKNKGVKFECHFIGAWSDISENEFMQEVEKSGLQEYVFAYGGTYGTDKDKFFYDSDVFIFPTYNETFGLVNLEAMQFSLPVVSTAEGGILDVVTDGVTGFLVPKRNVTALARKIEVLINDAALRHKMGEAGRERYDANFTKEKFEERLVNILKDSAKPRQ
jgi:glycosyltransferase involved in cell wall biosynthesis